jgi:uncharacterized membrane protein
MSTTPPRILAARRVKAKRDFLWLLASSSLTLAVVLIIWAATGAGSFWPLWVLFGLGVALIVHGWRAYGPHDQPVTGQDMTANSTDKHDGEGDRPVLRGLQKHDV